MDWLEIALSVDGEAAEAVAELLQRYGHQGVAIEQEVEWPRGGKSIYFREPSGVLYEIATLGPGFAVDVPQESLGEKLSLPPDYEHLRSQVEANLKPIHSPRQVSD